VVQELGTRQWFTLGFLIHTVLTEPLNGPLFQGDDSRFWPCCVLCQMQQHISNKMLSSLNPAEGTHTTRDHFAVGPLRRQRSNSRPALRVLWGALYTRVVCAAAPLEVGCNASPTTLLPSLGALGVALDILCICTNELAQGIASAHVKPANAYSK
jgi:hypothetical protein